LWPDCRNALLLLGPARTLTRLFALFHGLQFDRHLPVLTVAETLEFAHACAGKRPDFISKQELKEV